MGKMAENMQVSRALMYMMLIVLFCLIVLPLQGGVADGVHNNSFSNYVIYNHCNKKEIAAQPCKS